MDRLGVDIGGTFTDLYFFDSEKMKLVTAKVPSTPRDYTTGVINVIRQAKISLDRVKDIIHGSTIATNAVIERKLPVTPFITTKGFRDIIEFGRYHREKLYDPYQTKPEPLVKRRYRYEVMERVDSSGRVVKDLDENEALAVVEMIRQLSARTVAIGFLNSYVNPVNEEKMEALLLEKIPGLFISTSSKVLRKIRPLGRFTTTILNAALRPIINTYIEGLTGRLRENGFRGNLWLSQSNGGIILSDFLKENPEVMLLSGPSMGIIASSYVCNLRGEENVVTLDMGGTSADVSLIEKGEGLLTTERQIDWDMPVPVPMMSIETIGAGGGSIAWVDQGGMLKVGPQSAGADPGPVCYGRGGKEPTVTDANLLMGRLNPKSRLGGELVIDVDAGRTAVEELGRRLGLNWLDCAKGILKIVQENMANAVKRVLISKSRDPRDYVLVAFGGAGPMHACAVARSLGIPKVLAPYYSGVLCALGASIADVTHNLEKTYYAPMDQIEISDLNQNYGALEIRGKETLVQEGFDQKDIILRRIAEMRYVGQTYEVETAIPSRELVREDLRAIKDEFDRMHETRFGLCFPADMAAFVNLRVSATGVVRKEDMPRFEAEQTDLPLVEERDMYFSDIEGFIKGKVYDGEKLASGMSFSGPVSIELKESTVIVPPRCTALVDAFRNILIEVR
jgi:N-methylhydantoinase A